MLPLWQGATSGGAVNCRRGFLIGRILVAHSAHLERIDVLVMKSTPYFGHESGIGALDGILHPMLMRRCEYGGHLKCQAKANHGSEGVWPSRTACETRVVVELREVRETNLTPKTQKRRTREITRHRRLNGPRADALSEKSDGVEYVNQRPTVDLQILDDITRVELQLARRHIGQVPSGWRCRPSNPSFAIKHSTSAKHAFNCGCRRWRRYVARDEFRTNGSRAAFSERTLFSQPCPYIKNQLF
jgi:hypothetical protein